jgi:hypothetical protein
MPRFLNTETGLRENQTLTGLSVSSFFRLFEEEHVVMLHLLHLEKQQSAKKSDRQERQNREKN